MRNHLSLLAALMLAMFLVGCGCGGAVPCTTNDDCGTIDGAVCAWDGESKASALKRVCTVPTVGQVCLAARDCGTALECRVSASGEGLVCQEPAQRDCTVGDTQACYTGPAGTLSKGLCKAGTQTCGDDGRWGECTGQILPKTEVCEPNPQNAGHKKDEDCDGEIDEGFDSSESCLKNPIAACREGSQRGCYPDGADRSKIGKGICKEGIQTCLKGTWGPCAGAVVPSAKEACNSQDDNCDGQIDEGCTCEPGIQQPCGNSQGECKEGIQTCQKNGTWGPCTGEVKPKPELCDGKDNDCNGQIDEGLNRACKNDCGAGTEQCQHGSWVACSAPTPKAEICNGKDDDCDGAVDEGFALKGLVCVVGIGECRSAGTYQCRPDGAGVICSAQAGQAKTEICGNDKDDDCDGSIDEGCACIGNSTRPCGSPIGECKQGTQICLGGKWDATCTGAISPVQEKCNGKDDDCDGSIDEDFAQIGQICVVGTGACQATAKFVCSSDGSRVVCSAVALPPKPEVCDGKDNDCDGQIDEGCPCTAGQTRSCGVNQGICQAGQQICLQNSIWGPCQGSTGPQIEVCNGQDDDCDGQTDEDFSNLGQSCTAGLGECQSAGRYICSPDGSQTICNAQPKSAARDVCDGKDNDCDGSIDEDYPTKGKPCSVGQGACMRQGTFLCQADGTVACSVQAGAPLKEACNGQDDDCDGQIDEDFPTKGQACTAGQGPCQKSGTLVCNATGTAVQCNAVPGLGSAEVCNGQDDDCDGQIDNGFPQLGQACAVGVGQCANSGVVVCDPLNNRATRCSVNPKPAATEQCNGKDDDCDGAVDENYGQLGQQCIVGKGQCTRTGTFVCDQAGTGVMCSVQPPAGSPIEKCDGVDDNCDGRIDEGCNCTDGQTQSCYGGAAGTAGRGPCKAGNQICQNGQWGACIGEVTPKTETCNNIDDDCNGTIDDNFNAGTACTVGVGECQRSGTIVCLTNGQAACNAVAATPIAEKCDGKDNDCDGLVDEDFPTKGSPCASGLGTCQAFGKLVCKADGSGLQCDAQPSAPVAEKCDGLDNDCDGQVDEDFPAKGQSCTSGSSSCSRTGTYVCKTDNSGLVCSATAGQPTTEVCNGVDDNCDGSIDETFPQLGKVCVVGVGECVNSGVFQCDPTNPQAVKCSVSPKPASNELCDGKDNDCDGQTDEDFPNKGLSCAVGVGECRRVGVNVCKTDGSGLECNVAPGTPTTEICDNKDNDCNGLIDDNLTRSCYTGAAGTAGVGPCKSGTQSCQNGSFGACVGEVTPVAEKCDGVDNDCDGSIDENFATKGQSCSVGIGGCLRTGTFVCNQMQTAVVCSATAGTPSTEVCDGVDNDCDGQTDEGAVCVCTNGQTRTCYTGPAGTAGIGACKAGTQTCQNNVWGACQGEVVPTTETCNGVDDDCNGTIDNVPGGCSSPGTTFVLNFKSTDAVGFVSGGISYIGGGFRGTQSFGTVTLTGATNIDNGFVAKVDGTGKVLWAKGYGGGYTRVTAIVANSTHVYAAGFFQGSGSFGGTTLTSNGGNDIFVLKLDTTNGNVVWAKMFGGAGVDNPWGITVDAIGNTYITGEYNVQFAFAATVALYSPSDYDIFVAKFDTNGNPLWATNGGGGSSDRGRAIAVDASGNVYAVGSFTGPTTNKASFGSAAGGNLVKASSLSGSQDAFVAKWSSVGVIQWVRPLGGNNSDVARGILVSGSDVFVAGAEDGSPMWAKLDATGGVVWKQTSASAGLANGIVLNGTSLWLAAGTGSSSVLIEADSGTGSFKQTKAVTGTSQEARAVGVSGGVIITITSPYLDFSRILNADSSVQGLTP